MTKQILIISPFTAYKKIRHAGGKIHYYYLSKIENNYDITTISIAKESESDKIQDSLIKTKQHFILYRKEYNSILYKIASYFWTRNPFDKYAGFIDYKNQNFLYKTAVKLKKQNYFPDAVILDWTQAVFLSKKIKKLFPNAYIICVEQDVTYLKYQRFYEYEHSKIKKIIFKKKYQNIKNQEIKALKFANEIITLNTNDRLLLEKEITKTTIRTISPYFDSYKKIHRDKIVPTIIYFGAMSRSENYLSAIWFIKNVLPKLPSQFKFIVIGNSPVRELQDYTSERVIITGYVLDITPYIENALCFAAPIVNGAGIKIKILEAMSASLPVLTNYIGIEGIPATNNKEYIHCESPLEYVTAINTLYNDVNLNLKIGINARQFIKDNFNYQNCSYLDNFKFKRI